MFVGFQTNEYGKTEKWYVSLPYRESDPATQGAENPFSPFYSFPMKKAFTYSVKGYSRKLKGKSSPDAQEFADRIQEIADPKNLETFLYLNRHLTREEYEAKVIEIGYRAMLKTLVAMGCSGDTKALDLGLKRCDLHFAQVRKPKKDDNSEPTPALKPRPTE